MSTKTSKKTSKATPLSAAEKAAVDTVIVDTPATSGGSSTVSSVPTPSLLAASSSAASTVDAAKAASHSSFAPLVPVGISLEDILAALRTGTPELLAEVREALGVTKKASAAIAEPKAPRVKKEKSTPAPLPVPEDGSVPTAASYRMNPSDIDHTTCVARILKESDKDKRWKPAVYREHQCCKDVDAGSDLCSGCTKRQEKAAETGKHGAWTGRVTEDPPSWCHMLGPAASAKFKWNPDGVSDSASVASSHSSTTEEMDAKKEAAAAKKAAAAAKKEAATAAKAEKPKKEKKGKAAVAATSSSNAASVPAVADTSAPVATVAGGTEIIGNTMYWVRNGNAYDYDEESKTVGAFIGRMTPAGGIDDEAEEEVEEESDSE
jgi:hypothetical protein